MIVLNDLYDYGLKIYQNTDYFKFSLDSILLGEFVKVKKGNRILDICTGNTPIPLILSTKSEGLTIDALEIQKEISEIAQKSIEENNLTESIHIIECDAREYLSDELYDIVTCNPPYFKVTQTTQKNDNEIKRIARHEVKIDLQSCVEIAYRNLKETGTFYLVHRIDRFLEATDLLREKKFGIRRITFVYTKKKKPAEFFLIEASKYKKSDPKIYSIETEGKTSYKKIFEEE